MSQNKNNNTVWNTRIKKRTSNIFKKVGASITVDKRLYKEDILVSVSHAEMLYKQKIITIKIKDKILWGLKRIQNEIEKKKFKFDESLEDIHMNIENRLFELIGNDAGYLHAARSRNDQVVTDLKLWLKKSSIEIDNLLLKLIRSLVKISEKNIFSIMPGFTHLKNAQPISLAHYFLSNVEMFKRDRFRFSLSMKNLNQNPLGACAFSGTSFNIDRWYTTKKLKFDEPTNNSLDTVSDRDFVLDFLYNSSVCSMHISRIADELIIWNSDQFKFISLKDNVVTGSSIMPQKKNPDTLEFLRGKTGSIFGNLFSMLTIVKGLPISYFKDLQDDKDLIFRSFDNLKNCLIIFDEVINGVIVNKKIMLDAAKTGFTLATDFADALVKNMNFSFREAYLLTAKVVNLAEQKNLALNELDHEDLKRIVPKIGLDVMKNLNLRNSVNSKKSYGGTSFENIKKMIRKHKKEIK